MGMAPQKLVVEVDHVSLDTLCFILFFKVNGITRVGFTYDNVGHRISKSFCSLLHFPKGLDIIALVAIWYYVDVTSYNADWYEFEFEEITDWDNLGVQYMPKEAAILAGFQYKATISSSLFSVVFFSLSVAAHSPFLRAVSLWFVESWWSIIS